ncbi:MAG: hypothetical protein H6Q42_4255 [Deltaproteobacteria bacterium]|jgi:hypothetical protein|nr:hypothetical protein [Deltaproteobacteria bacterium]
MVLWDAVKKGAEEGLDALKEGVSVFVAEAGKQSKILKKRVELSSVQNNLRKTFIRLGSQVYDLYIRGEQEIWQKDGVKELIGQIESYKTRVGEIDSEIETIKKEEGQASSEKPSEVDPPIHLGG